MKRLILIGALVGAIIGAAVLFYYVTSGPSDWEKAQAEVNTSSERLAVAMNQEDLTKAVLKEMERGDNGTEVIVTNRLLLSLRGMPDSYRRTQIDEALSALENSNCSACVSALESARP
jgi:hypothetical protein